MDVSFDDDDLRALDRDMRSADRHLTADVEKILDEHANAGAEQARSDAPEDRPWLSTPAGIVVSKPADLVRAITSPIDPKGESVGYRVEEGTSVMRPRPFLVPAMVRQAPKFHSDLVDALVRASL